MTARYISLRPSSPTAQCAKDACKASTAEKRATRQLRRAMDAAAVAKIARGPVKREAPEALAVRGLTLASFAGWFKTHYANAAEVLAEHEFLSFRHYAMEFYFGRLSGQSWNAIRRAMETKLGAAHMPSEDPYRRVSREPPRPPPGW